MQRCRILLSGSLVLLLALPWLAHAFGDEVVVGFMVPLTKKGASYGVQSRASIVSTMRRVMAASAMV